MIFNKSDDSVEQWFHRGLELYANGDYRGAVKAFDKAIALDPDQPQIWNNRGIALTKLGKFRDALQSFDKAIAIDPTYQNARDCRKMVLAVQKKTDTPNERKYVVEICSLILAGIATLLKTGNPTIGERILYFIEVWIGFAILIYIIYWLVTKYRPQTKEWGYLKWSSVLIGSLLIIGLVTGGILVIGNALHQPSMKTYSNYGISFQYPANIPINTSDENYVNATYYKGQLKFDNPDEEIGILWFPTGKTLSQDEIQDLFSRISTDTEVQNDVPDFKMSSIQKTIHGKETVYYVTGSGHDTTENGKMVYVVVSLWEDPQSQRDFVIFTGSYRSQEEALSRFNSVLNLFAGH